MSPIFLYGARLNRHFPCQIIVKDTKDLFKMQSLAALTSFKFQNDLAKKINKATLSISALTDLASRLTDHIPIPCSNGAGTPTATASESSSKAQGLKKRRSQ